jgi:hypothetical protein
MGGVAPFRVRSLDQPNPIAKNLKEFKEIGKEAYDKKNAPRIKETRRQEALLFRKKKSENNSSETNKKTLLGE